MKGSSKTSRSLTKMLLNRLQSRSSTISATNPASNQMGKWWQKSSCSSFKARCMVKKRNRMSLTLTLITEEGSFIHISRSSRTCSSIWKNVRLQYLVRLAMVWAYWTQVSLLNRLNLIRTCRQKMMTSSTRWSVHKSNSASRISSGN